MSLLPVRGSHLYKRQLPPNRIIVKNLEQLYVLAELLKALRIIRSLLIALLDLRPGIFQPNCPVEDQFVGT